MVLRGPCGIVRERAGFLENNFSLKNGKNVPKIVFFILLENLVIIFFLNLVYKKGSY